MTQEWQNPERWTQWRNALADYPDVLKAIDTVEDCEGDLADAAITLALQARLEPDGSVDWLMRFAKRFRPVICRADCRQQLAAYPPDISPDQNLRVVSLVRYLVAESECPSLLVFPVALWVLRQGQEVFCEGFLGD
ncbi:MAG: hypothetical protein ACOYME_11170 [Prochlorotrichaceae cyanobacterium]|jgi:hypothetical protein